MIKRYDRGFAVILIFLAVVIALGGLVFLNQKFQFVKPRTDNKASLASEKITYKSPKFKYQIEYSKNFSFLEDEKSGDVLLFASDKPAEKGNEAIYITVRHKTGDEETSKRPLAEYAKTAAIEEIQSYNKLNSIETVTTKNGEVGYKTTWNRSAPFVNGKELNSDNEPSGFITYFGFPYELSYTAQFYLYDNSYLPEYNQILESFVTNKNK